MPEFESQLTTLSDDMFEELLGDVPDGTVNPSTLIGGTKPKEEVKVKPVNKETEVKTKEEVKVEEVKQPSITAEEFEKDVNLLVEDSNTTTNQNNSGSSKDDDVSTFFKAKYEALVKKGVWEELDEKTLEEFDWSEDNYVELATIQAQWSAEAKFTERLEASGEYGKAIFEHIEKGGDPNDIISLFRELKEIKDIDTSTVDGKISLLYKYYVDELNWPQEKFKKFTDTLIDKNELDDEVTFANSKIETTIKQRVEEQKKQAEIIQKQQEEAQKNFASKMQTAVVSREDIPKKEQQEILNDLLKYDKVLPDGRRVNQFTLDFMKMQSDPNEYVDFIRYVKNPKKYKQSLEEKVEDKVNKKTWGLIKGGAALSRTTATKDTERNTKTQQGPVFDYKSLLDNR